jgi:uncharacterized membrane protein
MSRSAFDRTEGLFVASSSVRLHLSILMAVLIVLLVSWLIFRGIGALGVTALATWQDSARYGLAVMFVFTATAHFNRMKHDLARMIPSFFLRPLWLVYITGVLELLGAAGLLVPKFRSLAGTCLIALLIGMFVANLNAALTGVTLRGKPATPLWLRTPMQVLFIAILWWSTRR